MKKLLLILLGFVISVSLFGQKEDHQSFRKNHFFQSRQNLKDHRSFSAIELNKGIQRIRTKSVFSEPQRLDSIVEYEWNGAAWVIDYKEEYIYNDEGLITEYLEYLYNSSSDAWELNDRELYEYNDNGKLILYVDFEFDGSSMLWYDSWQREYAYDANNLLSEELESQRDDPTDTWYYVWRTVYSYDENDLPVSTLEYINTIGWQLSWSTKRSYDENGNLIKFEDFDDDNSGGWVNEWQETWVYENNLKYEYTEYEWNESSDEWENSDYETWEYHDNNNVAVYYDYDWSDTQNDWELSWKEEYEYDNTHTYDQLVLPWFYHDDNPNYMNHRLTEYANYNYESSNWTPAYMGEFYYSADQTTATSDYKKQKVSYFPNPATSQITFKFDDYSKEARLKIYDITGNLVHFDFVTNDRTINLRTLSEGLYLFRLIDEKNQTFFSDKILLE